MHPTCLSRPRSSLWTYERAPQHDNCIKVGNVTKLMKGLTASISNRLLAVQVFLLNRRSGPRMSLPNLVSCWTPAERSCHSSNKMRKGPRVGNSLGFYLPALSNGNGEDNVLKSIASSEAPNTYITKQLLGLSLSHGMIPSKSHP